MEDPELTRYVPHPFLHIVQAVAERTNISSIKSHAIVVNPDPENAVDFYFDHYMCGTCVFDNIMKCFLYGEINITTKFTTYKNRGKDRRRIYLAMDTIIQ